MRTRFGDLHFDDFYIANDMRGSSHISRVIDVSVSLWRNQYVH